MSVPCCAVCAECCGCGLSGCRWDDTDDTGECCCGASDSDCGFLWFSFVLGVSVVVFGILGDSSCPTAQFTVILLTHFAAFIVFITIWMLYTRKRAIALRILRVVLFCISLSGLFYLYSAACAKVLWPDTTTTLVWCQTWTRGSPMVVGIWALFAIVVLVARVSISRWQLARSDVQRQLQPQPAPHSSLVDPPFYQLADVLAIPEDDFA